MPHDPSPNAITIIQELYFTDVECIRIMTNTDEWDLCTDNFNLSKVPLKGLYQYLEYPYQCDVHLIKIYFKEGHSFYKRYPNLKCYETSMKWLKYLVDNYPKDYYIQSVETKTLDLDNPTTPLID
jgi:hypothetical protein